MEEPNLGGGLGGSAAEGNAASSMGNSVVNSRLSVDLKMLEGLNKELNTLNENTKKIKSNFKDLISNTKSLTAELNKAATAMGKVSGKSSSGYLDMGKGMPAVADMREMQMQSVERILGALGKGGGGLPGGGGGGGTFSKIKGGLDAFKTTPYGKAAMFAVNAAVEGAAMIDDRVDRNKGYALPADKLSVQLQQQYGMSQMDVMNDLRGPLRSRRLGMGGINELLSMQSRTGINAAKQAGSVEGLRTLMGYGYSAGDATQYIESLGQADTVNRMFMMTGTSLYGIGGKQKSAQQVNQDLIGRLGLNNREIINAGRQDGSMVRQRLKMSGLDQGAQDLLLQYAESNVSFTEKGGKGFYDPSKKSDRKRMGIEGNYATQEEETTRTEVNREEQMYKRQADNYAQMEKNLQNVNKLLGEFEDQLSSIIGVKTSTRGFGQIFNALGKFGVPFAGKLGEFIGDPGTTGSASPGRIASVNPTSKKDNQSHLSQLKPVLREPLARLLMARPGIGINGSYRSADKQKEMFLSRYYKTDEKTETYYDGSYWMKKPGVPMAAPPGLSYHEIGLAADLSFASSEDEQWLKNNASKYGLDEFSRLGEPWHVQSKAYPASRKQYEGQGASYGTEERADTKYVIGTSGSTAETGPMGQSGSQMSESSAIVQQMSMAESVAAFAEGRTVSSLSASASGNSAGAGGGINQGTLNQGKVPLDKSKPANKSGFYYRTTGSYGGYGYYVPKDFSNADIDAVLQNETGGNYKVGGSSVTNSHGTFWGGFNISDYNWNRIKQGLAGLSKDKKGLNGVITDTSGWGKHANDTIENQRLGFEYHVDAIMAHDGYEGIVKGNINWPGVGKLPAKFLGPNTPTTTTGDPFDTGYSPTKQTSSSAPSSTKITTGATNNNVFNVNPTINVTSTGSVPIDAAKLAKEVTKLIDRELKMNMVRSS